MSTHERLFAEYVRALDDRRFDDWLALFAEEATYAVMRAEDHRRGSSLFLLRETKEKLRNRIEMGASIDQDMRIHLLSGIRAEGLSASANFAVLRNGALSYSGQYHFALTESLKIKDCLAVVANNQLDLLYLPI